MASAATGDALANLARILTARHALRLAGRPSPR